MRTRTGSTALVVLLLVLSTGLRARDDDPKKRIVVVPKGSAVYHEAWCPVVKTAGSTAVMTVGKAEVSKLTSHDCQAAMAAAARTSPATQLVWVDLGTRRYHLAGCSLVGLPRAQMPLPQAAAKYKPCNKCKPPGA